MKQEKREKNFVRIGVLLILSFIIIVGLSGVVFGANAAFKKYFGIDGSINEVNIDSFIDLINNPNYGSSAFLEIFRDSPMDQSKFIENLNKNPKKNEFIQALLKSKYKSMGEVKLGDVKLDIDSSNNLIFKASDKSNGFKVPINPKGDVVSLVSVKQEDGKLKLAYDPQNDGALRTLSIDPSLEGSVNPENGNYITNGGEESQVGLLHGKGGELGLSMEEDKLVVKISKILLTDQQKANYKTLGLGGIDGIDKVANTPVVKLGSDYGYGSPDPYKEGWTTYKVNPLDLNEISVTNGEMAIKDSNAKGLAYIRNSVEQIFSHQKGSIADYKDDFDGKLVLFEKSVGENGEVIERGGIRFGKDVYAGIGLQSEFDYLEAYKDTDEGVKGIVDINDNGVPALRFEDGKLFAARDGSFVECNMGSVDCVGFPLLRAAGGLARVTVRGAGFAARGVGAGVRGVGKFIANRPVVNFFREVQPVRSVIRGVGGFFREVQPVRSVIRGTGEFFSEVQPVRRGLRGAAIGVGFVGRGIFGRR